MMPINSSKSKTPMIYHLKFFQMMNLNDFQGDVRKKNDVAGRLWIEWVKLCDVRHEQQIQ